MRKRMRLVMLLALPFVLAPGAWAANPHRQTAVNPQVIDNDTWIDVNSVEMVVTNHGSIAYDLIAGDSGLIFPKGTEKKAVFAAGLWVGAKIRPNGGNPSQNHLAVTVGEYSQEYSSGTMNEDGTFNPETDPRFRVYKINRGDDASTNPDYADWPFADGAPADQTAPGYDPENSATWTPGLTGDQTLWAVYNDADPNVHSNDAGNSDPLGIEVQQTVFGFDRTAPLGNMVFVKWKFINKGANFLDSTYVSVWSDPDLGGAADDLVGCDTTLSLGYCYNEDNDDETYGSAVPAVGYDFFQGPIVASPGDTAVVSGRRIPGYRNLPMTSFNKYINGTDPGSPVQTYNYMQGLDPDGLDLVDPTTNRVTKYFVAGDPVTGQGWLDTNGADRRLMLSSGPFTMAPGDTQEVVCAVLIAQGSDRLSSISLLKEYDRRAQAVFDLNFLLPSPPPRPTVYARPYDREIDLVWGTEADNDVQESPELGERYIHEGFNVYQGESVAGPWKKIITYDVEDSIALVYGDVFDVDLGGSQKLILQNATNNGLSHHLRIDQDYIRGGPLANYKDYFFAVTAWSVEVNKIQPYFIGENQVGWETVVLENSPAAVTVAPKSTGAVLEVAANHRTGSSDGRADIVYVDQSAIEEKTYEIVFRENPDHKSPDPYVWDLRVKGGATLLEGQTQQTEDLDDPVVNGFIPNVVGPPLAVKSQVFATADTRGRWISGVASAGLSAFGGGMGLGFEFFGSTLPPAEYGKVVLIKFSADGSLVSEGATLRRDQGYTYGGIGTFPGAVYDITSGTQRRLNVGFVEFSTDDKPANLRWDPDGSSDGHREYLFILNSDYNGGVDYGDDGETHPGASFRNGTADVLLAGWLRTRDGHTFLESDADWTFTMNFINTTEDVFEFTTHPVGTAPGTVIDNNLKSIRAVPNPYYNNSSYELNQFSRIIRFVNLPARLCTIRIFNVGGDLVRTLEKTSVGASDIDWDVETENGIPVASGIYIYHVEAKGLGTTVGKVAIFTEKERLNRY